MKSIFQFAFKETIRSKYSFLVISGMIFSLIMPFITISISETLMNHSVQQSKEIYGEFGNILYSAEKYQESLNLNDNIVTCFDESNGIHAGTITTLKQTKQNDETIVIGYMDDTAQNLAHVKIKEGTMPEKENEIALTFSANYRLGLYQIGDSVTIDNIQYRLSGIVSDYSAVWSKPENDSQHLFPNMLVSYSAAKKYNGSLYVDLLLENSYFPPSDLYYTIPDLIQNVNLILESSNSQYQMDYRVLFLLFLCSFLLFYYVISFYFNKQMEEIAILRCICLTKWKTICYMSIKLLFLILISLAVGIWLGIVLSFFLLCGLKQIVEINSGLIISKSCITISVLCCIAAIIFHSIIQLIKLYRIHPIDYLFEFSYYTGKKIRRKPFKKISIFKLVFLHFLSHYKSYFVAILLFAFSVTLFNYFAIQLDIITQRKAEVEGRMTFDFDYEFLSDATMKGMNYVDKEGNHVETVSLPTGDNTIAIPNYTASLPDDILELIKNEPMFEKEKLFLECNNLILENQERTEYVLNYMPFYTINQDIQQAFGYSDRAMSLQAIGYDSETLKSFAKYVVEGEINIDKIIEGKEVILMAPTYEIDELETGGTVFSHISEDRYTGKSNQYRDDALHAGQTIEISQVQPNDLELSGYITKAQAQTQMHRVNQTVKIGAIIHQRVGWFDNATTMPTAYVLLWHQDTFKNLNLIPTHSRLQLYVNPSVSIEQAESTIRGYLNLLPEFLFLDNMLEMQEFRTYRLITKLMHYVIICTLASLLIGMLFIQNKMNTAEQKKYFALLKINGMDTNGIKKYIFIQDIMISLIALFITIPLGLFVIIYSYSDILYWTNHLNAWLIGISLISIFVVNIVTSIPSLRYLKKSSIMEVMREEN